MFIGGESANKMTLNGPGDLQKLHKLDNDQFFVVESVW